MLYIYYLVRMHHRLNKEHKKVIILDKENNIKSVISYKEYKRKFNSDLFHLLMRNWEYKTQLHDTKQLDLDF